MIVGLECLWISWAVSDFPDSWSSALSVRIDRHQSHSPACVELARRVSRSIDFLVSQLDSKLSGCGDPGISQTGMLDVFMGLAGLVADISVCDYAV